jgi:ribosomal protein S18 acetylase RimI-like enzyme
MRTEVGIALRDGRRDDEDALVALEAACFRTDRIARRSFRAFLASKTARLRAAEVDGRLAGYALTIWRAGSGVARLYSIAVDPARRRAGLARALLADAEKGAYAAGRAVMRLEVAAENAAAIAIYARAGYRRIGETPGYYEDGADALRMEKPLRAPAPAGAPAYYAQTTEFTCGAACLMMARRARDPSFPLEPVTEVRLWRAATTVFMGTGLGGCEPYGMAVALAEAGLPAALWTSLEGPLMLRTVQNPEKRRVMELAQADFRARIAALRTPVHVASLSVARLAEMLGEGALAILLISGNRMLGKQVPHWIFAWGAADGHVFVHDPWIEDESFESEADAAAIPIPFAELDRMWRWGADRLRAAVVVEAKR